MIFVFFIYGLVFFILGFSIFLYPGKESAFKLAKHLRLLGVFGITHGVNEWIGMFILIQGPVGVLPLEAAGFVLLPVSFYFLIQFGTRSIVELKEKSSLPAAVLPIALPMLWAIAVVSSSDRILAGDIWARYALGLPGTVLTSYALLLQSSELRSFRPEAAKRCLKAAAGVFLAYGVLAGLIVPEASFFPASMLNYSLFLDAVGFPVQVIRALCAVAATFCVVYILRLFDRETSTALQRSKDALEKANDELEKRVEERTSELITSGNRLQQEIIERTRAEELIKAEHTFRTAIEDSMLAGVHAVDLEGRLMYVNPAFCKMVGWRAEELMGKTAPFPYWPPEEVGNMRNILRMATSGEIVSGSFEVRFMRRKGERFDALLLISPLRKGAEKVAGWLASVHDITERKKLERELAKAQKLESVGALAGGIAHDFNNILMGIMGNISLAMLDPDDKDKILQRLSTAEKSCNRAKALTQQLLTFAKGGEPVKNLTSVGEIIRDAADLALKDSVIKGKVSIPDDLWPAEIDEGQILQAVNNLVVHAVESMSGGGTVRLTCENFSVGPDQGLPLEPGNYIKITVQDQGDGVSPEDLQKIFDPYFIIRKKGSGLGLAASYSIIKNHDGCIMAESEIGKGMTFFVYLPASRKTVPSLKSGDGMFTLGRGRILIMDDEDVVSEVVSEMLKHMGYDVESCRDGSEAIEQYMQARKSGSPFDVVIMDLTVPGGMGGKETIEKLRGIDPDVKALVSSGYSNDPIMANCSEFGFQGVVVKPYKIKDLSETLHRVIEGNRR